jgi:hypothetical protein
MTVGNDPVKDGCLAKLLADTIRKLNAVANYFVAQDGLHCALIFFDMKDSAELPAIAEPLFMGLTAEIEVVPAMNADDLKQDLGAALLVDWDQRFASDAEREVVRERGWEGIA